MAWHQSGLVADNCWRLSQARLEARQVPGEAVRQISACTLRSRQSCRRWPTFKAQPESWRAELTRRRFGACCPSALQEDGLWQCHSQSSPALVPTASSAPTPSPSWLAALLGLSSGDHARLIGVRKAACAAQAAGVILAALLCVSQQACQQLLAWQQAGRSQPLRLCRYWRGQGCADPAWEAKRSACSGRLQQRPAAAEGTCIQSHSQACIPGPVQAHPCAWACIWPRLDGAWPSSAAGRPPDCMAPRLLLPVAWQA